MIRFAMRSIWALLLTAVFSVTLVQAQVTSFTYQGFLRNVGAPANGTFDFEFGFFDAQSGGSQLAAVSRPAVSVASGTFTVQLDALSVLFDGQPKYIEIRVKPDGSAAPYDVLAPRQLLMSAPFAVRSLSAATADSATNAVNSQNAENAVSAQTALTAGSATTVTGVVPLANGGTGATTAAAARTNLQLGSLSTVTPTGSAGVTTFLRGDNTWANPTNEILVSADTQFSQDDRAGWTQVATLGDDTCVPNIPLGFTFTGWGRTISTVSLSSNGVLFFGQNCSNDFSNTVLPSPISIDPFVAFFWDDMIDQGAGEFAEYATFGSAGGRVFNLYFRNRLLAATCGTDAINLMLSVHEGSNLVKVVHSGFSTCSLIRGATATFGMQGPGGAAAKAVIVGLNSPILDDNASRQSISYLPPRSN